MSILEALIWLGLLVLRVFVLVWAPVTSLDHRITER